MSKLPYMHSLPSWPWQAGSVVVSTPARAPESFGPTVNGQCLGLDQFTDDGAAAPKKHTQKRSKKIV